MTGRIIFNGIVFAPPSEPEPERPRPANEPTEEETIAFRALLDMGHTQGVRIERLKLMLRRIAKNNFRRRRRMMGALRCSCGASDGVVVTCERCAR